MPVSVFADEFKETMIEGTKKRLKGVNVAGESVQIQAPFPSPEEWRDQVIYFIMIDRFNNPEKKPTEKWNHSEYGGFQGGTLKGITEKLDYIKSLGATAIWITPPFKNCQYDSNTHHGYGIQDFLSIDPRFGSEEDLSELVDQAHAKGMYIICDIVLNHVGNVFAYQLSNEEIVEIPPFSSTEYNVLWRDADGKEKWESLDGHCDDLDACVWPKDLQENRYYRRKGTDGGEHGDFFTLRELVTEEWEGSYYPVRDILIKCYQYLIARFDIDGMRIDTLKYIEREFARTFGNAIREFALQIGKKNFFTFGEVYDDEGKITEYIGRYTHDEYGIIGVDAALDFPLFWKLPAVIKGSTSPLEIANVYEQRKEYQRNHLSSHGEAGKYFVTFIDNHDQHSRFYQDWSECDEQVVMAIGALLTIQGIPCIYYGTEQGLSGHGHKPEAVREALWGKIDAFDQNHHFYKEIQKVAQIRAQEPALRYGRQYFRPISGNDKDFSISKFCKGILSFSRILSNDEILVVINSNTKESWSGKIVVDFNLNRDVSNWEMIYSNLRSSLSNVSVSLEANVNIEHINGDRTRGDARAVDASLMPMEIQILKRMN